MEGNSDTKNLCVLCASETNPIFGETLSDKLALCQLVGEFGSLACLRGSSRDRRVDALMIWM